MKQIYVFYILGVPNGIEIEGEVGRGLHERFVTKNFSPGEIIGMHSGNGSASVRADYIAAAQIRQES